MSGVRFLEIEKLPLKEQILARSIPVPFAGCWLWLGSLRVNGYGTVRRDGRSLAAHRAAWEEFVGPIPDGLSACHRCDTPSCVNPDHLFLGTYADNNADRDAKGRGAFGERHHKAKLTLEQVQEMRSLHAAGRTNWSALGRKFGIHRTSAKRVALGLRWRRA